MPQRRMVHHKIWDSDQFSILTVTERLLYIALITGADDEGCFRADAKYWKRIVFYDDRIGQKKVQQMIGRLAEMGLIIIGQTQKGPAGFHPNWHHYQTLRKERAKPSEYHEILVANSRSPVFCEVPEEKIREDKEEKIRKRKSPRDQMSEARDETIKKLNMNSL